MTTFPSTHLAGVLQSVMAPTKKPQQGQHSFVRLATGDHSPATISARNDRLFFQGELTGVCGDSLDTLIHAELLQCAISSAAHETSIEIQDGRAKVVSGSRKSLIPILPVNDMNWPERQKQDPASRIVAPSQALRIPLSSAANTASRCLVDDFQFVEFIASESTLGITSTNRRSLSSFRIENVTTNPKQPTRFVVPDTACEEVIRAMADDDVIITAFPKSVGFMLGPVYIETQQVETTRNIAQAYEQITANKAGEYVSAQINRCEFLVALKAVKNMAGLKETTAVVTIDGGVTVSSKGSDSESETRIECQTTGSCKIYVACEDLLPLLGKIEDETLSLSYWTETNFILFSVTNGSLMSCLMR